MSLEELTHEDEMIRDHGVAFLFGDKTETLSGKPYMYPQEARVIFAEAIPDDVRAIRFTDKSDRYAIVHPSTMKDGEWQASYFDHKGAFGDSSRKSKTDAIIAALEYGFTEIAEILR